jgi:dTDP-4-dehydrorhamnose reductase
MWLVTGATGQLGQALTLELHNRSIKHLGMSSKQMNFNDPSEVQVTLSKLRPEVIINAAAYTQVDEAETKNSLAWRVNAGGPRQLAKFASYSNSILAHVSTDYVFSGTSKSPYLEDEPLSPINVYGQSKAAGEEFVLSIHPSKSYIFRTAWLYSASGRNFAKTITRKALANQKVEVVDTQVGQPTFVKDVATRIVESILGKLPYGVHHATNSGEVSWFGFAREIYQLAGANGQLVTPRIEYSTNRKTLRPSYSVLSHNRWEQLGLAPMRDWKVALRSSMPEIMFALKTEEELNGN